MWWSVVIVSRITSWALATLTFKEFCWNLFDIFTTFLSLASPAPLLNLNLNFSNSAAALVLLGAVSAQDTHHCPDGWFWHVRLQSNLPLALLILWHVFSLQKFKFPNIFCISSSSNRLLSGRSWRTWSLLLFLHGTGTTDTDMELIWNRYYWYGFVIEQVLLIMIWNWCGTGTSDMELIWKRHWYDVMEKVLIWNRYWYDLFFHN